MGTRKWLQESDHESNAAVSSVTILQDARHPVGESPVVRMDKNGRVFFWHFSLVSRPEDVVEAINRFRSYSAPALRGLLQFPLAKYNFSWWFSPVLKLGRPCEGFGGYDNDTIDPAGLWLECLRVWGPRHCNYVRRRGWLFYQDRTRKEREAYARAVEDCADERIISEDPLLHSAPDLVEPPS